MKTTEQLITELAGLKCTCGAYKNPKQTFCRTCYFLLPKKMQMALYQRVGEGYEEAYDLAQQHIDRHRTP